jgi:hypothetical protein
MTETLGQPWACVLIWKMVMKPSMFQDGREGLRDMGWETDTSRSHQG